MTKYRYTLFLKALYVHLQRICKFFGLQKYISKEIKIEKKGILIYLNPLSQWRLNSGSSNNWPLSQLLLDPEFRSANPDHPVIGVANIEERFSTLTWIWYKVSGSYAIRTERQAFPVGMSSTSTFAWLEDIRLRKRQALRSQYSLLEI